MTPLAGAGVICAGIYYGLRLEPVVAVPESTTDSTRCVLLSSPVAADIRTWERNLYDWAALRDPTLLVLPNERFGFSRERFAKLEIPSAPVPAYEYAMIPLGQDSPAPIRLCAQAAGLPERVAQSGEPIRPPPIEPALVEPLPRVTFWRFPDGRMVSGLPGFDERRVREACATTPPPKAPTTLRVSRAERLATARVMVSAACGNAVLDGMAVDVLRRAVTAQEMQGRLTGQPPSGADYMPPPGGDVEVQVEWATSLPAAAPVLAPGR